MCSFLLLLSRLPSNLDAANARLHFESKSSLRTSDYNGSLQPKSSRPLPHENLAQAYHAIGKVDVEGRVSAIVEVGFAAKKVADSSSQQFLVYAGIERLETLPGMCLDGD